jgi:cytochrome c556
MKISIQRVLSLGAAVFLIGCGAAPLSTQDREAAVADRQATMKAQSAAMAGIKKYLDDAADQTAASKNVDDLVKLASILGTKFPLGTSTIDFPGKSGARPVIWTAADKFSAAQKTMVEQLGKLDIALKSGNKKAAADQFAATGKEGCGGCHNTFREKLG